MKLEFSRQIFEKYSNIKSSGKSVQWEPSCVMETVGRAGGLAGWRAGRHEEANILFSQFF
jgi:hypothetical protein